MTPLEHAASRGHAMASEPSIGGNFARWQCRRCLAALFVNKANPKGFGTSLERDCLRFVPKEVA